MKSEKRECGSCTKCCDGWLKTEIPNHRIFPSRPCHFVTKNGCSIYKDRPNDPCRVYKCQWLIDENLPHWMKPNEINAIIHYKIDGQFKYYEVIEAGGKLMVEVLNWFILLALEKHINVQYTIMGAINRVGSVEFVSALKKDN